MAFLGQGVSPQATFELEKELARLLRRSAAGPWKRSSIASRPKIPRACRSDSPSNSRSTPQAGKIEQSRRHRHNFGTIPLRRFSCEPLQEAREDAQYWLAPLELQLGIVTGNATPALAERVAFLAVGHTQQEVLHAGRGLRRAVVRGCVAQSDGRGQ